MRHSLKQVLFSLLLKRARSANGDELNQIIFTIVHRHKELFPEWELTVLSVPCRDEDMRKKIQVDALSMLRKYQ